MGIFEGKIFAVGGFNGPISNNQVLSSVEYFCPLEGVWNNSSPLNTPRACTSVMVLSNKIFVLGGHDGTEKLQSVECFQPGLTRAVWYQVPNMLNKRANFAAFVMDGKLVVVGGVKRRGQGEDVEFYCAKENKWTPGGKMNISRWGLRSVLLYSSD